ncbi:MAG TPA: segregation/condensation protein A [Gemmatimonadaceae bacterium]|nr:segregation/condensation protein A [Gemmatimonadaceae bacterium]
MTSHPLDTPDTAFVVELDQFNGPLDLLLTLIREEQVEIIDIPIARIAEQFLQRVHSMGLTQAAEYLEMAARLLRIKAQLLLPRPEGDEDWEDPRAELVRRLLEYQQIREVVEVLEDLAEERRNRFARGLVPGDGQIVAPAAGPLALSLPELMAAVDRVLRMSKDPHVHDVVPRALDVAGAITIIRTILSARTRAFLWEILPRQAEPWQVLSALLGLLELAKLGELKIVQPAPFQPVEILRDAASEAA